MKNVNGRAMTDKQIEEYMNRIGLDDFASDNSRRVRSIEFLTRLQRAHISHIPFENIDIMEWRELSLDREALFQKIIAENRGGVCSELNTLYNWLLESLGFDVTSYISRIIAKSAPLQANSHRIMAVSIGGSRYITDVGFNYDHHRVPLILQEGLVQSDGECAYRFERDDFRGWIMYQQTTEGWRGKISFSESPQCDLDFIGPTYFAQHHPNSKINRKLKVSIHRNGKFYAIREGAFLTEEHGIVREIEKISSKARLNQLLVEVFGLDVTESSAE